MSTQNALVQIAVAIGAAHMLRVIVWVFLWFRAESFVATVTIRLTIRLQFADLIFGTLMRGARI